MKEKGRKTLIVLSSIILSAIFIAGIGISFFVGYDPKIPSAVQVIDDGSSVRLCAESNDNYSSYRFKFENDKSGNIYISSLENVLTMDEMLHYGIEIGKEYSVTVTYITEDDSFNSQQSEVLNWKAYDYLETPNLYRSGNYIRWGSIENADYYEVHYNLDSEESGEKVVITENPYYDLQDIEGGERDIYVYARSNNDCYKTCLQYDKLELEVVHQIPAFENVRFDGTNKILTMTSSEKIKKMIVYINETPYEIDELNPTFSQNVYNYSVSISHIYESGSVIGIAPATIDQYNVYFGNVIYIY